MNHIVLLLGLLGAVPHAGALTPQTITGFAPATPITYSAGKTFALTATGGGSGKPIVFASSTTGVCTVAGTTASVLSVGTCTLTANQAGSGTYSAARQVTASVVINKGSQTIAFAALGGKSFGTAPFTISATASSGLAVAFTSTTTTVCSIAGASITLAKVGTCTIAANQAGDAHYKAATQVTRSFAVGKGTQTITFGALAGKILGAAPFTVSATASSGLAVNFTSTTTTVCAVAGSTVTLARAGTCTIAANQAGNANYSAAAQVARSFAVQPAVLAASITSPVNNATFTAPANIPVVVSTTVPVGQTIAQIAYYSNGVLAGSAPPGSQFSFTSLPAGTYALTAIATDAFGHSASSAPVVVTVAPPPQTVFVSLTSPANGATYVAPATISLAAAASATSPGASIGRVDFYRGQTLLGTSTRAPFAYTWTGVPAGRHALTAVATDSLGATGSSAPVHAVVDGGDTCDIAPPLGANDRAARMAALGRLPITFEENAGQSNAVVRFQARTPGFQVFLTESERVVVLQAPSGALPRRNSDGASPAGAGMQTAAVRMRFVGANPHPMLTGSEPVEQRSHYLLGDDPAHWHTDVRHFAQARYHDVYPGVDEVYSGRQGKLEYDLHVAPGANPRAIRLALDGVDRMSLDESGDLLLDTALGTLVQKRPIAYQDIAGARRAIAAGYRIVAANEVTFVLGEYDAAQPLVIDPVLVYSTLLGGTNRGTAANAIALSRCGEAYIGGETFATDFPTTAGAFDPAGPPALNNLRKGFIAKLNASGTGLLYSTYLTGASANATETAVTAVAVDATGHAFVAGNTSAPDFPTTADSVFADMPPLAGGFVAKLNNAGSGFVYSSYLPGSQIEGIAIDGAGAAYVAGGSSVWKVNATGATLDYSIAVGGTLIRGQADSVQAIAVDAAGNAYVAGIATSTDLPVTAGAFQAANPSASSAGFVSKINPAGTGIVYSTYLGTTAWTQIFGLALDAAGNAHVAGRIQTGGTIPNFTGTFTRFNLNVDHPGNLYAFVAKLNAAGSQLEYFSSIGGSICSNNQCGSASTWANAIALDANGSAWVTGPTGSNQIPLVKPFVSQFNSAANGPDIFVARLAPAGNSLAFSTLLGGQAVVAPSPYGDNSPRGTAIAVDAIGSAYVAGTTNHSDFPTTPGALQTTLAPGAGSNAFVVKINDSKDTSTTLAATPSPGAAGSPVVLTATIDGNAPTGNVTYFEGAIALGTATIAAAAAPFTASASFQFTGGSHSLKAVYEGDAHNNGSTSPAIALNVTNPNSNPIVTLTGIADGATLVANAGTTYTAANMVVNASAAAGNTLSQARIYQDGSYVYWTLSTPNFGAGYTLTTLSSGMHTTYASATDNFNHTATSAPIRFVVNPVAANPPAIAITAPANGASATAPGPIAFTASAVPAGGNIIGGVSYFQGTALIGSATTAPYSFTWTNVPAGTYSIVALATDNAGGSKLSAPITVTVTPAPGVPGAPTLTGASPGAGSAALAFTAPASNGGSAITGYIGVCNAAGQPAATAGGAANAAAIVVTGMAGGTGYSCTVSATNNLGTGPASNSVNVTPLSAPSVTISAPANNAVVSATGLVDIVVDAQVAPNTIARIELFDGPTLLTSIVPPTAVTTFTYSYPWSPGSLGSRALTARVTDSAGATITSSVVTALVFYPPSATLNVVGNFFLAPADIDLHAAAASAGTTIRKVEFFNGAALLAALTTPPYTYRWGGVAAGSYTLTARATDVLGLSATSAPVNVRVGSAMGIAVDAGVDGSTVNDDNISFAGSLQAPANSAVDISGRPGVVTLDGRFFFNNLPLQPGSNSLIVTVTDIDGRTASQTVTVNSNGQAPFVFTARPVKAIAPLATGFTLANRGNVAFKRIEFSCNDNGVIDLTAATVAQIDGSTCTFNLPANGRARVTVIGQPEGQPEQVIYTATQSMYSISVAAMDRMLRGVYADMLGRLKAGKVTLALNAVTAGSRDRYGTLFGGVANLAEAVDRIGTIRQGTIHDEYAEYLLSRPAAGGDAGYFIYLVQGRDGIWRIDAM